MLCNNLPPAFQQFIDDRQRVFDQVRLGIGQVLVEESLCGWDEFELEVVRDHTGPLPEKLTTINGALGALLGGLEAADRHVGRAARVDRRSGRAKRRRTPSTCGIERSSMSQTS